MEQFLGKVEKLYQLSVFHHTPLRQGYALETDKGYYLVQSAPISFRQRTSLVQKIYTLIERNRFSNVPSVLPTRKGNIIFTYADRCFYLTNIPSVMELNHDMDLKKIGKKLADFHRITAQLEPDTEGKTIQFNGTWTEQWNKRLNQFEKYRDQVAQYFHEDHLLYAFLLPNYTYLSQLGETAIRYLHAANYNRVCSESVQYGRATYQRFQTDNIMVMADGDVLFINPLHWVLDTRARDIGQFIKNFIYENGWDSKFIEGFLKSYHENHPLNVEEVTIIYGMLLMPGRFIKRIEMYLSEHHDKVLEEKDASILERELDVNEKMLHFFPEAVKSCLNMDIPRVSWL